MTSSFARPLPAAAPDPFLAALSGIAATGHLFSVLDGTLFADPGYRLLLAGVEAEPLYLDEASSPAKWAGPLLVWPGADVQKALHLAELTRAPASALWWHWPEAGPEGRQSLFRHLRRLNMVEIPQEGARASDAVEPVLLRHGDPEAMAALLPLLSLAQIARFLGPARAILLRFTSSLPGDDGTRRFDRPADLPVPAPGMLRLTPAQMDRLLHGRATREEARVIDYLRRHGGPYLPVAPEGQPDPLPGLSRAWLTEGKAMGIRGEQALWKWSLLQLLSGGQISADPKVRAFLSATTPRSSADDRVGQLMRATINRLRKV